MKCNAIGIRASKQDTKKQPFDNLKNLSKFLHRIHFSFSFFFTLALALALDNLSEKRLYIRFLKIQHTNFTQTLPINIAILWPNTYHKLFHRNLFA